MPQDNDGPLRKIVEQIASKGPSDIEALNSRSLPDELRGLTPTDLDAFVQILDAHLRSIHQDENGALREKSDAEEAAFAYGLALRDKVINKIEEHRKIAEVFRRRPEAVVQAIESIRRHASSDETLNRSVTAAALTGILFAIDATSCSLRPPA